MTNKQIAKEQIKRYYLMNKTKIFKQSVIDQMVKEETAIDYKIEKLLAEYEEDISLRDFSIVMMQQVLADLEPVIH